MDKKNEIRNDRAYLKWFSHMLKVARRRIYHIEEAQEIEVDEDQGKL